MENSNHKQYKNPPIQEAVCEVKFEPVKNWNEEDYDKFYEQIKSEYPEKPQKQYNFEISFSVFQQEEKNGIMRRGNFENIKYQNTDKDRVVILGENLLRLHIIKPYKNREELYSRIDFLLKSYNKLFNPTILNQISVRYVNKIYAPAKKFLFSDYFNIPIGFINKIDNIEFYGNLNYSFSTVYTDNEDIQLFVNFLPLPEEGKTAFILDIQTTQIFKEGNINKDVIDIIKELREREYKVFESSINDGARKAFDNE